MNDPYENLGNAIILQAVKDYREALRKHSKRSRYDPAIQTINGWSGSSVPNGSASSPLWTARC